MNGEMCASKINPQKNREEEIRGQFLQEVAKDDWFEHLMRNSKVSLCIHL